MSSTLIALNNDLDSMVESILSSSDTEICLNAKFMYRHQKHTASKLKKSKSAYMFFSADVRANLKQQGSTLGPNEIMKEISDLWKTISKKDKAVYEARAQEDKERYRLEKEHLLKTNPSQLTKNRTKNNHIKKPWSAYDFFMNEVYPQVKADNPTLYSADILKIVSKKWKAVSQSEKDVYQQKSEADKKEKRAQLRAFELKRVLESSQGSPVEESVSTQSKSRKRVKLNNLEYQATTPTTSISYDFSSPEMDDTFEIPTIPVFPNRLDSLLEDLHLALPTLKNQPSQQASNQNRLPESFCQTSSLQRLPSIDYAALPPLRLEDFRFGSFIESSLAKCTGSLETQLINILDTDHHAGIDNLFGSGLSRLPSFYPGGAIEVPSVNH